MKKNKLALVGTTLVLATMLTGCGRGFDKPQWESIGASETAFLIPTIGDVTQQKGFGSEEYLKANMVATKDIQIPHIWRQTGRTILGVLESGEFVPSARLIKVDRKPESRDWTASTETGTSTKNQGFKAETQESIGFSTSMSAMGQIVPEDASKYLYNYNGRTLADVMDTDVRLLISQKFAEICPQYTLADLLKNKEKIMTDVRDVVLPAFKAKGVTLTIGINGDLVYANPAIQASIDDNFKSDKAKQTQENLNVAVITKAKADAEAIAIQANTLDQQVKLKSLENQKAAIDKWDGKMPTVNSNGGMLFNIPTEAQSK